MKKLLVILLSLMMLFGIFAATASAADISFTDVKPADWFYNDVKNAVNMGLVNGKSATIYAPNDNMTYAEATKLAACMHEKYTTGKVTQGNSPTGNWYDSYVEYAKANGIISGNYNWNAPATRAGYMSIFAHALPDSAFTEINNIPDDTIPDVKISDYYGKDIYKLYRAGVLEGSTDYYNGKKTDHLCKPADSIKRSEVAAILTRMMDPSARKTFSTAPGTALTITGQPQSVTIVENGDAKFTVAVSGGTAPYAYEWHRIVANNGNYDVVLESDEALITGTQTGALTTKQCAATENGDKYYCVVSDAAGNKVTSNKATLTVQAAALYFTKQPANVTIADYGDATFAVKVNGGSGDYSYEWHKITWSGEDKIPTDPTYYSGYNTDTLKTVKNYASIDNGAQYYCIVTDNVSKIKITSNKATLTVKSAAAALTITKQPANTSTTENGSAKFSVTASGGTAPYYYTWHRIPKGSTDDYTLQNNSVFPGADTANLTVNNCQLSETGDRYYCVVKDATGKSVESSKATLTVKSAAAALTITSQPKNLTVNLHERASFSVTVSGGKKPYSYEWRKIKPNGADITPAGDMYEGLTSATMADNDPYSSDDGAQYYCVITDADGNTVTSKKATLTVIY